MTAVDQRPSPKSASIGWLAAAGASLLLAACTPAARPTVGPAANAPIYPDMVESFRLMDEYERAIARVCGERAAMGMAEDGADWRARFHTCALRQVEGTFGNEAQTDEHCTEPDFDDRTHCIWYATTAWRLFVAGGVDPATEMDWSDITQSILRGAALVEAKVAGACLGARDTGCVAKEMGSVLLLPGDSVAACAMIEDQQRQVQCVADAFMAELIRSALLYVG